MEKLQPCPFCGEKLKILSSRQKPGKFTVYCQNPYCVINKMTYDNEADLITAWNRRPSVPKKDE